MKLYRKTIIAFLVFGITKIAYAQSGSLSGRLQDQQGEALPYANVAVMKAADSALVTGAVTNGEGAFHISSPEAGKYFLRFSAIGYSTVFSEFFISNGPGYGRDFGPIEMKEEAELLQEVSVKAMRPQVVVEADKMVVSVEGTALASGSTAFEVLSKSPGVWVDQDGNLQMNGKKGVVVMVDGRPTYLSSKELQAMLEGMPAENIKNIELITNPSAKYDAEGTAGILNINLKKNTLSGMNGSLYAGYQYNQQNLYNAGTSLNYKKGRWNSFGSLDLAERGHIRDQRMVRGFSGERGTAGFEQSGRELRRRFLPSLRVGADYELNERHSFGVVGNLSYQEGYTDWNTLAYLNDYAGGQDMLIGAQNHLEDESTSGTFNFHYTGALDTAGTTLSADLDYVRLSKTANSRFLNQYSFLEDKSEEREHLSSSNLSAYDIYSARIDLKLPFSGIGELELGAKVSHVISDSKLRFYTHEGEEKSLDEGKSNDFIYKENIYATYANFSSRLNETWSIQGGLRAEKTVAEGRSLNLNQSTPRNYLNLFPSLFVQQNVSDDYQLSYSYSRRITRPDYGRLNPFVFYIDPYTYIEGNPGLRPQYTHSLKLTQSFLKIYNLVIGFDHSTDNFGEVPLQDPETKLTAFAIRNLDNFRNYSATIVAPVQVLPVWSINNNIVMAHQQYSTIIEGEKAENTQFFFMAQSNHQIKLPMDIMMEFNAAYRGPVAYGLYQIEDQWWVDAGLKRSFMEEKLNLSLNVTDIFRSMQTIGGSNINGNTTAVNQYFGTRGIRLNLRYSFNKGEKFSIKNRDNELEELNRAGGN